MKLNTGSLSILKEFIKNSLLLKLCRSKKSLIKLFIFKYDKVETNKIETSQEKIIIKINESK